jgi:SHS2 domain-containing protein
MYEFVDHPSEALIRVKANTIHEVFVDAATALFDLMTDLKALTPDREFKIELESEEKHWLLIDWLNRLILLHEVENVFLCTFQVDVRPAWRLSANVKGQSIDKNQERRLQAKSATYGQLKWYETPDHYEVQFLIDV